MSSEQHVLTQQLDTFRRLFPVRSMMHDDKCFKYHISAKGKPVLVLLPGGLGNGEAFFAHFLKLMDSYTVITFYYGEASTMRQIADALDAVLRLEGIESVQLLGQSFGGLVAQYFYQYYPQRVEKMILSHTTTYASFLDRQFVVKRLADIRKMMKLVRLIPKPVLAALSQKKIRRHIDHLSHKDALFWSSYFQHILTNQSKRELLATYQCMIDFISISDAPKWNDLTADKLLIVDSPADRSISADERLALLIRYPKAAHLEFEEAGHLSIITEIDRYLDEVRKFLG